MSAEGYHRRVAWRCGIRLLLVVAVVAVGTTPSNATPAASGARSTDPAPLELLWHTPGDAPGGIRNSLGGGIFATWGGDLYVADCDGDRIHHFTTDGEFVEAWGNPGGTDGLLSCPKDLTRNAAGNLLVVDEGQRRVQEFTTGGAFVRSWPVHIPQGDPFGNKMDAIDVDDDGNVYVTDTESHSTSCDHLGNCVQHPPADGTNSVHRYTPAGDLDLVWAGYPTRYRPEGIWITSADRAFVINDGHLQENTLDGTVVTDFTDIDARDVAIDHTGNIWTAAGTSGIRKYSPAGTLLASYANPEGPGQVARGIAVDQTSVYVVGGTSVWKYGIPAPALSVEVSAAEAAAVPGQTIHFEVAITNTGNQDLTEVAVTDGPAAGCVGPVAHVMPGATAVVECTYVATMADIGVLERTATVDTAQTGPETSDPASVTVAGEGIVGTVTEDGSADPLPGAYALALRAGDLSFAGGAEVNLAGEYFLDVPPGAYLLEFADPAGTHAFEWYDDQPNPADLGDLPQAVVSEGALTTADAALAPTRGAIAGTLSVSSGGLARQCYVVALRNGSPAGWDLTDDDGNYRIEDLNPGGHHVLFLCQSSGFRPVFYDGSATPSGATPVEVAAGATTAANGSVERVNAIDGDPMSGRVLSDAGGPVANELVVVLRASDMRFVAATMTGPDGRYVVDAPWQPSLSSYVQFADPTGAHQFEWYDDQPSPSSFEALTRVEVGSVANAVVHDLQGDLAGTVTDGTTGDPIEGVWVVASGAGGIRGATTASDGTFRIEGLSPGSYVVVFVDPTASHAPEFHPDSPSPSGASVVTVTAANTATVDAALAPTPP